ncbi:hypothetical protein ACFE04_026683 [Oxalis oulophora]
MGMPGMRGDARGNMTNRQIKIKEEEREKKEYRQKHTHGWDKGDDKELSVRDHLLRESTTSSALSIAAFVLSPAATPDARPTGALMRYTKPSLTAAEEEAATTGDGNKIL